MINNHNVSAFNGPVPTNSSDIALPGPIYSSVDILKVCKIGSIKLWSNGAIKDARTYQLTEEELVSYVSTIFTNGQYQSSQWCQPCVNGPWAAADGYILNIQKFMLDEMKVVSVNFYFKFALNKNKTLLLMVSNHRENY